MKYLKYLFIILLTASVVNNSYSQSRKWITPIHNNAGITAYAGKTVYFNDDKVKDNFKPTIFIGSFVTYEERFIYFEAEILMSYDPFYDCTGKKRRYNLRVKPGFDLLESESVDFIIFLPVNNVELESIFKGWKYNTPLRVETRWTPRQDRSYNNKLSLSMEWYANTYQIMIGFRRNLYSW